MTYIPVGMAAICLDCDVVFSLMGNAPLSSLVHCPVCLRESWMPLSRITGKTGVEVKR